MLLCIIFNWLVSQISHLGLKFLINLQMSQCLGGLGDEPSNQAVNRGDCIFMGKVLTAECRIIDRHINDRGAAVNGFSSISTTQNVSPATLRAARLISNEDN